MDIDRVQFENCVQSLAGSMYTYRVKALVMLIRFKML